MKKLITALFVVGMALTAQASDDVSVLDNVVMSAEDAKKYLLDEGVQQNIEAYQASVLEEGVHNVPVMEKMQGLLQWAIKSKNILEDTKTRRGTMSASDEVAYLTETVVKTVINSAPARSETFLRWSLNRALKVLQILSTEANDGDPGMLDTKLQVLRHSIDFALKYYPRDMAYLKSDRAADKAGDQALNYADFGLEYFLFLTTLSNSVTDASAQYRVMQFALVQLTGDLNKGQREQFAYEIVLSLNQVTANEAKEKSGKMDDQGYLAQIRQMKSLVERLPAVMAEKKSSKTLK